jgi:hypothetical protein
MMLTVVHSSSGGDSDGDLPLLLKGKVLESLVEALVVGILLFHLFRFVVVVFTFVIFVIELPSEGCENEVAEGRNCTHTGSYITLIIKLQLGHVAMSSQSLSWALEISKRSPQGHG